jgi:magnesium chelatase family protein
VREAGDRVRTAIQRAGLQWPQDRLVVNLAPADLPKVGTGFDLTGLTLGYA